MGVFSPSSHRDVLRLQRQEYIRGVDNGKIVPFTYPMGTYGAAVLFLIILLPPSSPLHGRASRYAAFGIVLYSYLWIITNCRGYNPAPSFGIGLLSSWGILWAANLLVFKDTKALSKKLEYVRHAKPAATATANGNADGDHALSSNADGRGTERKFTWQSYPNDTFSRRLYWCWDLVTNFRGVAWTWKISGLPSYPSQVQKDLAVKKDETVEIKDVPVSKTGIARFDSYWTLVLHNSWLMTKGYLTIDLLKTIMNHDPYFWGQVHRPPPGWLPSIIRNSFFLTRGYRLLVSMSMVWMALRSLFCLAPLFFIGFLGPFNLSILGADAEPWLYPDHFGSYSNVFERGLAGWWGGWWHQTFRHAFQEAGKWATRSLNINQRSLLGKTIFLFVAFSMSGFLHASGSMTQMGDTRPIRGPFLFFVLQPIGLILEMLFKSVLKKKGWSEKIPNWVAHTANFVYVHLWFCLTGPLLTDDFAKGGVWLFEPIMLSPLRGLGYGTKGDGFFCWGEGWERMWYWDKKRWYMSGIAF